MANPLKVNAAELLRRPGNDRTISTEVTVAELGIDDDRFRASDAVAVALHLEALNDGIVVNGTVVTRWHGVCRRCATNLDGELRCDVGELYQNTVTDPEAFELVGEQLDLTPMVREVLVLDAPATPLCRADCAGLCPRCGIDFNTASCRCDNEIIDHRWSALDQLKNALDG